MRLFVQSTVKSHQSRQVRCWGGLQEDFLNLLYEKTRRSVAFEKSDFAQSLICLESFLPCLGSDDTAIISDAIAAVRAAYGEGKHVFCAYHGDFTPWNMFVEQGRLFVFDFEYAGRTYPPFLDYFHFMTQTAVFERKLSAEQIISLWRDNRHAVMGEFPDLSLAYRSYLLDIISKYIQREQGEMSPSLRERLGFWITLLAAL